MNKRILVVDDEPLLALDIAQEITLAGFSVLGPATSVTKALELVCNEGCDAAVLDVNLRNETSEKIAVNLRESKIPFLFLSGLSRDEVLPWMYETPFVSKPVDFGELFAVLNDLVQIADEGS